MTLEPLSPKGERGSIDETYLGIFGGGGSNINSKTEESYTSPT